VSGNDLTATTTYKADFNVGEIVKGAVIKVREAAARTRAQNNLKQIGLALHSYQDNMNRLPIHGVARNGEPINSQFDKNGAPIFTPKPLLSWRVEMLPYIEETALYNEFKRDEPWDSEHNMKLVAKMPKIYHPVTKPGEPGKTHVQQIIGPTCMMPGRFTLGNITDGTSNTIAVAEAAVPVIWTKPDDVYFSEKEFNAPPPKDLKKKFGGLFPNGFNVTMWDGSVRFVDARYVSDQTLWNLLRPADGNVIGGDW
jgi:prepilin-type processing-associated H-X9-DG protein